MATGGVTDLAQAHSGLQVWNPSFDVTPAALITGIITERGLVPKAPGHGFDVPGLLRQAGALSTANGAAATSQIRSPIPGFYALDLETVMDYLADRPDLCKRVGPADTKAQWQARTGPPLQTSGGVVITQ